MFVTSLFAHPERLWLGLLIPAWLALRLLTRARRDRERSRLGLSTEPLWAGCREVLMLALLVLALGQPRWGLASEAATLLGHDLVLVVDVSRSMGAEDAVPDRLGVAVEAGRDLIARLADRPGNRAGLVAFAGRAVLRCPLTEDLDAVRDALGCLRVGSVTPGGTHLGDALDVAAEVFDTSEPEPTEGRAVVIFSDGEDHEAAWRAPLERLRRLGVSIHALAIGDAEHGAAVPSGSRGEPILSRRSDASLKAVADASGGLFLPLGLRSAPDLGTLYRDQIAPRARARRLAVEPPARVERFGLFVALAVFLWAWPDTIRLPLRASLAAWLLVAVIPIGAGPSDPASADSPGRWIAQGRAAHARGEFQAAFEAFARACVLAPESPIPFYDAGIALHQLGRFEEAQDRFLAAGERAKADAPLQAKIAFALGNTALARGRVAEAISAYDRCLEAAAGRADARGIARDALINRRFAEEHSAPPAPREDEEPESGARPKPDSSPPEPGDAEDRRPSPPGTTGGAARTEPTRPEEDCANTPEQQLDRALERLRQARQHRVPDPPPPVPAAGGKDW